MKTPGNLPELYRRFLNKESSPEDLRQLFALFGTADTEELQAMIHVAMNEADQDVADVNRAEKLKELFAGISDRVDQQEEARKKWYRYLKVGASAAAVIILGLSYFLWNGAKPVRMITAYAPYGKILKLTLPDSSKVWLNAGTTISYPETFSGNKREISLKNGQAYFEITHMTAKPFEVHARGLNVTVLGTSFEVTAFEKETTAKVNVNSGKVGVLSPEQSTIFLNAGEKAIIDQRTHAVNKSATSADDIAAWRSHELIFQDEALLSVMRTLERTYNVHIVVKNPKLERERVTTRFKDQTLNNVLIALSFSNHFKFSRANDNQLIVVN